MNLYKKIIPIAIVLGVLSGCNQYSPISKDERDYIRNRLLTLDEPCERSYFDGPFFDNMLCDEDIFPRRDNDENWVEDR